MVGWYHQLNGDEFEKTVGDGEGEGDLACCSPWGHKESDTTQQLNNKKNKENQYLIQKFSLFVGEDKAQE